MLGAIGPDVVHIQYQAAAYGLHPAVNLLPWQLRRGGAAPAARHPPRSPLPLPVPQGGPPALRAVLAMTRACDPAVVTNAEDQAELLRTRRLPPAAPHPHRQQHRARPPPATTGLPRGRPGPGPGRMVLCYFGFLSPAKGGETLVRALGLLDGAGRHAYRLIMVGGAVGDSDATNQAYLGQVWTLIRDLGLEDRVHWTGFAAPEEVSAHLLAADWPCCPTGGRQLAPRQPARSPGPRAAGRHHLPPDGCRNWRGEEAVLVPPGDPDALAEAVAALAANPARRARLGGGAAALARQFTWEGIAAGHLEVYRGLTPANG